MKKLVKTLCIAGVLTLATQVQALTIFSDNFNSENGGNYALNYSGFVNWTVLNGTVDLIGQGSPYDFYPGNGLYVDLDGNTMQAGTMVSTPINVSPGQYVLSFDLGGSQRAGANGEINDTVDLTIDTGFASASYLVNPSDPLTTRYLAFTVSSPTTLNLSFHNEGGDNVGAILDNVNLTVPDGGLTVMLLGMGLFGVGSLRRKLS